MDPIFVGNKKYPSVRLHVKKRSDSYKLLNGKWCDSIQRRIKKPKSCRFEISKPLFPMVTEIGFEFEKKPSWIQ